MKKIDELLDAWVRLSTILRNDRYIETMTFSEVLVCRLLWEQSESNPERPFLQIKELCEKTKMLKSALNRVLNDLENKNYIERIRFNVNRKNVYIKLTNHAADHYHKEHLRILAIVKKVADELGEQEVINTTNVLNNVSLALEKLWERRMETK